MKLDGWWIVVAVVGLAAGVVYFNQWQGSGSAPVFAQPDRGKYCRALRGEREDRLNRCLEAIETVEMSRNVRNLVDQLSEDGKLFLIGPEIETKGEKISVESQPEVLKALLGTNEADVAKKMRDLSVRGLVIHRDITEALDRDRVVMSRLAHHDHLEWFQLRYVSEELFVYTVRSSKVRIPDETGRLMLAGLRARLERRPIPRQQWKPSAVRLIGSGRLQGNTLMMRHSVGTDIESVLNDLAEKLRRRWEREVEIEGFGTLDDRLDELRLEIHIVMERAPVEPRSRYAMFDLFELGIDGMMYRHREGVEEEKFTYMPGSEAMTRSMRSADAFLRYSVETGGWQDLRPWEDTATRLDIIRTQHFMEEKLGGNTGKAVRLVRGIPPVSMDELTDRNLQQMLIDGGYWWLNNTRSDYSFEYKYWPTQNRRSTEYNEVRHILAARDLADAWRYKNDPAFLDGSRKAMEWLLRYQIHDTDKHHTQLPHPPPGSMLFRYPLDEAKRPNQKLGTVAVALLGWVAWAQSTGSHEEDERIRKMAEFTRSRMLENGKFDPYYVHRAHSYYGEKNDIVPGEAGLALGMVAEYFGENEWLEYYPRFIKFYQPWFRSRAKQTNPYGRWPHSSYANETRLDLVQFGPWAVMASKQYYMMTKDAAAAEFGLEIADWMIDYYEWTSDRAPFPDYVGGYYKLPEELPAMQSFCYSEGTAAAYNIAA
ncbi:MAG: hypothetical protein HN348_11940, partial [Proteobacteria bacterium]|nr:hypothetical protein [Pseudomonadota bacterium]